LGDGGACLFEDKTFELEELVVFEEGLGAGFVLGIFGSLFDVDGSRFLL